MKLEISNEEILAPIVEELRQVREENKLIISLISNLILVSGNKSVWKISDIARVIDESYDTLRTTHRYKLPRCGQSAYPNGPARWPVDEVLEWLAKPESEQKAAYNEHVRQCFREEARKRKKKAVN